MNTSFYNGIAGVNTSQNSMNIWGNNIANVNTTGFKANIPQFHTLFSTQLNGASPVAESDQSYGSSLASTAMDLKQGSFVDSDDTFNMAIAGKGWFSVLGHNGNQDYTKDGRFTRDEKGTLVNTAGNKLLVVNANNLTANKDGGYTFNPNIDTTHLVSASPTLSEIKLPNNLTFPPQATKNVEFASNLDTSTLAKKIRPAKLESDFNALHDHQRKLMGVKDNQSFVYTFGKNIGEQDGLIKHLVCFQDDKVDGKNVNVDFTINGTNIKLTLPDGSKKKVIVDAIAKKLDDNNIAYDKTDSSITFKDKNKIYLTSNDKLFKNVAGAKLTYKYTSSKENDFTTIGDFVKDVQNLADIAYPKSVQVSLDNKGRIVASNTSKNTVYSDSTNINMSQEFMDNIANLTNDIYPGTSDKSLDFNHAYSGHSTDIVDSKGNSNNLKFEFIKTEIKNGEIDWQGNFSLYDKNNKLLSNTTQTFKFDQHGLLLTPKSVTIDNNGTPAVLHFDKNGGLTSQSKASDSTIIDQDGFLAGSLKNYDVEQNGDIVATFSNNKAGVLGQIPLFHFENAQGLEKLGRNLYSETDNSNKGKVFYNATKGYIAGGKILSNKIEQSNVNFAQAMTEVIVTQKAFSASAKSITTSDEMIKTAINLKR